MIEKSKYKKKEKKSKKKVKKKRKKKKSLCFSVQSRMRDSRIEFQTLKCLLAR